MKKPFITLSSFVLALGLSSCASHPVEACSAASLAYRTAELEQCKTTMCEDDARENLSKDLDRCDSAGSK